MRRRSDKERFPNTGKRWEEDEDQWIRHWWPVGIPAFTLGICDLGRTEAAVNCRASKLGLSRYRDDVEVE